MEHRKLFAGLIVVLVLGVFLRTYNLGWETYSYSEVEIKQAADDYAKGNFIHSYYIFDTPPLPKYIFAAATVLQNSEVSLGLVSVLFGMMTVIAVFFLAKKLYGGKVALLAATITAFSTVHVQLSRYVQQETMLSFFYVMVVYFLWEATNENRKYTFLYLGIFLGLALATKFISVIVVVCIIVYCIYRKQIKFSIRPNFSLGVSNWIIKSFVVMLIVFCALWPFGFSTLKTDVAISVDFVSEVRTQQVSANVPIMALSFARRIFTSIGAEYTNPLLLSIPVVNYLVIYLIKETIFIIPLLLFGMYFILKKPSKQDIFVLVFISVFLIMLSFHKTNINYRHMTGLVPFFSIIASRWIQNIKPDWQKAAMVLVATVFFVYAFFSGPSYALHYNPIKDVLGIPDTDSKMSEGMSQAIGYIEANCTSTYAGPYYRFMAEQYYHSFVTFNESAQCVIKGDIHSSYEGGNVSDYLKGKNCQIDTTVYRDAIKILDIYKC